MAEENMSLVYPPIDHSAIYQRFSAANKKKILIMASGCGLLHSFVTGTFTPSIPQIARDLGTTGEIISFAVSVTFLGGSLGSLTISSYSTFYGRRPVYLYSLPILIIGSIGVATASSVASLLFWRFIQAIGGAPGLDIGAGVIGDIYKLEERGRAMGVFFATRLLGPVIAPVAGGFFAQFYSWRFTQAGIGLTGAVMFFIFYFSFPETSQPGTRGVDKLDSGQTSRLVFINPLRPLWMLRSPNLLLICIILSASMTSCFVLLTPLSYTMGIRYHISNQVWLGACFAPLGLGNIAGAITVGHISDRTVIVWKKRRGGIWVPEDRLRASLVPLCTLVPLSIFGFGLVNHYVDGPLGITLSLVCLFVNGIGVEMVFGPCIAYLVDVLHSRSAESLAANSGLRLVLMGLAAGATLPMIDRYGIVVINALWAGLLWASYGLLWCLIIYGGQMRAWLDIGFSTSENN